MNCLCWYNNILYVRIYLKAKKKSLILGQIPESSLTDFSLTSTQQLLGILFTFYIYVRITHMGTSLYL